MIITMCPSSVNFSTTSTTSKVRLVCNCSVPHMTVWPDILQLKLTQISYLPVKWAFGKRRGKRTYCRTSPVALRLPFSFTLLDKVFIGFIHVLLKPIIGNSLWKPHRSLRKHLMKPLQLWSFWFNTEGVIDSSWLSYIFALAVYTSLFLCKVLLQGC